MRGIGAWLLFALGTMLAACAAWASARSLYWPRTGDGLAFDAGLGLVAGGALLLLGWRLHRARDEGPPPLRLTLGAVALGVAASSGLAFMAEMVARHSSGWFDGIEYLYAAGAALAWVLACGLVLALASRTWRGFRRAVVLTAWGTGAGAVLFSIYLWARAHELQAIAQARNQRVPGAELALLLLALAALALARRRTR